MKLPWGCGGLLLPRPRPAPRRPCFSQLAPTACRPLCPVRGGSQCPTANREPGIRAQAAGLGAGGTLGSEGPKEGKEPALLGGCHSGALAPRSSGTWGRDVPTCPPPLEFIPVCQPANAHTSREEQTPALGDPGALKFQGVLGTGVGMGLAQGRLLTHECHVRNRYLVPAHLSHRAPTSLGISWS